MKSALRTVAIAVTVVLLSLGLTPSAFADDITILDTSGVVRAQGSLEDATEGSVTMTVTDETTGDPVADGTVITLTPDNGGAAITATTIGGQVVFAGLPAGTYTVASSSTVVFTSVGIGAGTTMVAGGLAGGSVVVVAAGVAGAGGITAVALSESNNDSSDPLSPIR